MNGIQNCLDQPYSLSSQTEKLKGKLASEISAHNLAIEQLASEVQKLRSIGAAQWNAANEAEADKLSQRRAQLLQSELGLRDRLADFFEKLPMPGGDLTAAHDQAVKSHQAATAKVREDLIKIGFQDDEYGRGVDELAARHPKVRALRSALDTFASYPHLAAMNENETAITLCQEKLEAIKTGAVGILSQ
jgi:hypothetical protein